MAVTQLRRALSPLILGLLLAQCGKDGAGPGTLTPAALVLISGNHQTGTVGQNLAQPLIVRVTTSDGRSVPNVSVSWNVTAGAGSLTTASTLTDASGQASVLWSLGTTAGTNNQSARAVVAGLSGSPAIFDASATAAAANQITLVSGNTQSGIVGQGLGQGLVVRVADVFNNPVSNSTVTWAVTGGGGSLSAPSTLTNAAGQASVTWMLGPIAGAQTAGATAAGLSGSPVAFSATAAAGTATQIVLISGNAQTDTVGQALAAPLTVAVRDAFANPVSGVSVSWAVAAGNGSVSLPTTPTDATGQAAVTWTLGTAAGPQSATASVVGLTGSPAAFTATATPAAPSQLVLVSGDAQTGTVGAALADPFVARVVDAFANPVAGVNVGWAVTAGGGSIAPSSTSDSAGLVSATLTLGTGAGDNNQAATATAIGLTGSPLTFTASANAGVGSNFVTVSGDAQTGAAGQPLGAPLVVRVVDGFNNPVSGIAVSWSVTTGGGSLSSLAGATDTLGFAAVTWTLGGGTGAQSVTATSAGLTGSPATFTATGVAAAAATLTLVSGNGQSGTVGDTLAAPFVVEVTDAFGNPVAGTEVTWAVTAGGGSILPATVTTDSAGLAAATLTLGTAAGTNNNAATATAAGLAGSPVTFTASAGAAAAYEIALLSGDAQSGTVATSLAAPFVVKVTDLYGNAVSGAAVSWAVASGGGSLVSANGITNLAGLASATLTLGAAAGASNNGVTATAAGLVGSPVSFSASATAAAAAQIALVSGDGQTATVATALASDLIVLVTDAYGNPVAGTAVTWTVTAGGGSILPAAAATDAAGLASAQFTIGTTAGTGTQTVTASAGGLAGSPVTFTASGVAALAAQIAAVSGNNQAATVGTALPSDLVVRVTDGYGNPVSGTTVVWAATAGGGGITPAAPTTDAAGLVSASLVLGPAAGQDNNTVTATATGLSGSPVTFVASGNSSVATTIAIVSGNGQTASAGQALGQPLVVVVTDGVNPVSGVTVGFGASGGGSVSAASAVTDGSGQASVTWTLGPTAGAQTATATAGGLSGSPLEFSATATAGAAAEIVLVSGDGQSGTAGSDLLAPFVVRVSDAFGNPVTGTTVNWNVTGGGGSIAPTSGPSDASGLAAATLTLGTAAGNGTHIATASAAGLSGSPVTFTASAIAGPATLLAIVSGNNQTATVTQPLASPFVVQVSDTFGNPVAGETVTWAVATGGGSLSATNTTTNALGRASVTLTLGTTAGAGSQSATATSGLLSGSPVTFTATATAGAAAAIATVSGDTQTGTVNQALASPFTVHVTDAYGNDVPGYTVTWAVTAGGGSIVPTSLTDAAGLAVATLSLGTAVGTGNHTATASGAGLAGSPLSFSASATPGAAATIAAVSGNGQAGIVNQALGSAFVVHVTDAFGNDVPGYSVTWTATAGGGAIVPASLTNSAGLAEATLTLGTVAGASNNTATASGTALAGSPVAFTVSAGAGAAAQLALGSGSGQTGIVGEVLADPFVVHVTDAFGNAVAGTTVIWAVTAGGGSIAPLSGQTDASGNAAATLTLGTVAGTANHSATATAAGLTGSPVTITASAAPAAASQIALDSGDGQTGTVGQALASPFIVRVSDTYGNDVPGYTVSWAVTGGGGSIAGSSITNASGLASATLTLGPTAGAGNNTAAASGASLTGSPVVFTGSAYAGAPAALVLFSGNNQAGTAATALSAPFVARVVDSFGNPVAGDTVTWAVTAGGGSIAPLSTVTNASGQASATLTLGLAAGVNNNTATATRAGLSGSPVTFTASANSSTATQIALVSGNAQTAAVGQALSLPLVVIVRDGLNNPVAGVTVGWTVTGGGGLVSSNAVTTDGSGQASVTWTLGTTAGAQTAEASAGGLSGSPVTFGATATPGAASQIALVSGNGQTGAVATALSAPLVVQVSDGFGNPIAGTAVTWAVTGGGGGIAPAGAVTDAAGLAAATLTLGTVAGSGNQVVTATASGLTGSPVTFTASANAGMAAQLSVAAGDGQSGAVALTLPASLSVLVADAFGNPVSGETVSWAVTAGAGSLSSPSVPSDGSGHAAVTWTLGVTAGVNTATATATGLAGSPVTFNASGVAGAAAQLALVSGNGQSGVVNTALADSFVVLVTDAHANPVAGATVTWAATAGGGAITPAAPTTNAAGLAWARLNIGTSAGTNRDTVTATAAGLSGSPIVFVATAIAAAASQITVNGGDNQSAPAATVLPVTQTVLVRDPYGNPVAGVSVTWAPALGGGSVSAPTSLSNASGIAAVTRTLGPSAGAHTTTATAAGLIGSPVTFTATATPNATISGTISTGTGFLAVTGSTTTVPARLAAADATAVMQPASSLVLSSGSKARGSAARPIPDIAVVRGAGDVPPAYAPDELIVTYHPAAVSAPAIGSPGLRGAAMARLVGDKIRTRLGGTPIGGQGLFRIEGVSPAVLAARITVSDPSRLDEVMAELRRDPAVASVMRNALAYADATTPNDPLYFSQAWDFVMMDLPRAWDITTGNASVLVAVVDDGIRATHTGIAANLTNDGRDFVSDIAVAKCGGGTISNADDGGGYDANPSIPRSFTYNTVSACATGPNATGGHGLHVAGTIGAVGNDGVGTTGVNWTVQIRPVRVLGVSGAGTNYDIAQGILYAAGLPADNGSGGTVTAPSAARIINLSLGGPVSDTTLHSAVISAVNAGALVIAAAGNAGTSTPNYPAAYDEALSVTAVGPDGLRASYSSYGSTVDIAAPGGDMGDAVYEDPNGLGITSTFWSFATSTPIYAALQGTSMATPHVSGVAALLLAQNPALTAAQLRARLEGYAVDAGAAGRDDDYGYGIVNARNALTQTFDPPHQLYARLYNATTGATIQTVMVAGNGAYTFSAVPDGDFYIYAGEDESADGQIGVPGRRWGAFGGSGVPTVVAVSGAGTYPRSFTVALPTESEANEDNFTTNVIPIGGYLNGTIGSFIDSDVSRLVIPVAGTYTIETFGQAGQCGYALEEDTQIGLYDSSVNLLASNDDIVPGSNYCSRITMALSPGLYFVQVVGFNARRYRVQVRTGS